MEGTIVGGSKVGAGLVATLEEAEWDRRAKPHVLADRLEAEAPEAGFVLDDQVKALRRGGSHFHYEIPERGPIRRKVRAEILEIEFMQGLGTLEGDPPGLRAGYCAKHQYR
jgi:hypothetical protein